MLFDESDRMVGRCVRPEDSLSAQATRYESALYDLMGLVSDDQAAGDDRQMICPQMIRPPYVLQISATNALCFAWTLLRAGETRRGGEPLFHILDVLGFKSDPDYVGFERFRRFRYSDAPSKENPGQLLTGLRKDSFYVNQHVVSLYQDVSRRERACLLDCTTTGVNWHVAHNMQEHVNEVLRTLAVRQAARRAAGDGDGHGGEAASPYGPNGLVVVFVHGTHTAFDGMMGLRFTETAHVKKLNDLVKKWIGRIVSNAGTYLLLNEEERFRQRLRTDLKNLRAKLGDHLSSQDDLEDRHIPAGLLWPLLYLLEAEASRTNKGYVRSIEAHAILRRKRIVAGAQHLNPVHAAGGPSTKDSHRCYRFWHGSTLHVCGRRRHPRASRRSPRCRDAHGCPLARERLRFDAAVPPAGNHTFKLS